MISPPRNERFEEGMVSDRKMSIVGQSSDSTAHLPMELGAFAESGLNLKVKTTFNYFLQRIKTISIGVRSKSVMKPGQQLFAKRCKSKYIDKYDFSDSKLFERDDTVIPCKIRRRMGRKSKYLKRKRAFAWNDDFVKQKTINQFMQRRFHVGTGRLKDRKNTFRSDSIKQSADESDNMSSDDLRHKLNCKTKFDASNNDELLEYKITIFNNCMPEQKIPKGPIDNISKEKLLFKRKVLLPQKDDVKSGFSFNKTHISGNLKQNINTVAKKATNITTLSDENVVKNIESTVQSPTEVATVELNSPIGNVTVKNRRRHTKEDDNSDTSDDENSYHHPNRRLQGERTDNYETTPVSNCNKSATMMSGSPRSSETGQTQDSSKTLRTSEMWADVLRNPELWMGEHSSNVMDHASSCKRKMDYHEMLADYVFDDLEEKINSKADNLYERRFLEKLDSPDGRQLLSKFYIPPAQVEVFYQNITDRLTAVESLSEVCKAMKWPEPEYAHARELGGHKYCCHLMEREFLPTKYASNEALAKELAAAQCLDWLGIVQRKSETGLSSCEMAEETYFG